MKIQVPNEKLHKLTLTLQNPQNKSNKYMWRYEKKEKNWNRTVLNNQHEEKKIILSINYLHCLSLNYYLHKCRYLFYLPSFQEVRHKLKYGSDESVSVDQTGFELGTPRFSVSAVNHLATIISYCWYLSFSTSRATQRLPR